MSALFPKQLNLANATSAAGTLDGTSNCFFVNDAGNYNLPALSGLADGTVVIVKNISAANTCTVLPTAPDTIDGGATANISLTSGGAGAGLGCVLVGRKVGSTTSWWRIVKAQ